MYDRHRPIIKWYEYDATKLYKSADSEDVTDRSEPRQAQEAESMMYMADDADQGYQEPVTPEASQDTSATGDPSLDDEVARIMAAFSGAKQNSVDDVFAAMAAEEAADASDSADSNEDLISSICAPKQNNVDDLVAMARGS